MSVSFFRRGEYTCEICANLYASTDACYFDFDARMYPHEECEILDCKTEVMTRCSNIF